LAITEFSHRGASVLLFDFNRVGAALGGRLPNQILVFFRYHVKLNDGEQLIFIILEYFGAQFIAVSISHALFGDARFHKILLCLFAEWMDRPVGASMQPRLQEDTVAGPLAAADVSVIW
jgi:hypothetical protein